MTVRMDKRGNPYMSCFACLCRAFIRSRDSLSGLLGISAFLDQVPELHAEIRASGEQALDAWLQAGRAVAHVATIAESDTANPTTGQAPVLSNKRR
jgi:hypothetical protein